MAKKPPRQTKRERRSPPQSPQPPPESLGTKRPWWRTGIAIVERIFAVLGGVTLLMSLYGTFVARPSVEFVEFQASSELRPVFTLHNGFSVTMADTRIGILPGGTHVDLGAPPDIRRDMKTNRGTPCERLERAGGALTGAAQNLVNDIQELGNIAAGSKTFVAAKKMAILGVDATLAVAVEYRPIVFGLRTINRADCFEFRTIHNDGKTSLLRTR